ncbi:MAG: 2-amino-4-hydroxy-6-hydroxymethyldihydropteridine diphosphokinase [Paludibacter sp.]|nr:2-amino-4-hydroxy-6-hydroxymethyldihydropteridine diphosphokinase [Paludibacter sp.]
MNTAIVMLGSNINGAENLTKAKELLSEYFEILEESSIQVTEPAGRKYKTNFHNQAIKILSDDSHKVITRHFKHIEDVMGRSAQTNQRLEVPIDIDLIFWNGVQKRNDYDKYPYVKQLVDEIKDKPEMPV